jgi:hypothetical protein
MKVVSIQGLVLLEGFTVHADTPKHAHAEKHT